MGGAGSFATIGTAWRGALHGLSANSLLDTGLRATVLCELGYYLNNVRDQTGATAEELRLLGFV